MTTKSIPDPKVQIVCGCCGLRSEVDPRYSRQWPECCGQRMDKHTDASKNQSQQDFNDWSSLVM